MSQDGPSTAGGGGGGAGDRRSEPQTQATTTSIVLGGKETRNVSNNGNGVVLPPPPLPVPYPMSSPNRLRLNPNNEHKADNYDDLQLDFSPLIFSNLEKYLPPSIINSSRETKVHYIRELLLRYCPDGERNRMQKHREYRQKIISNYQPLHRELYSLNAANFFVTSFRDALNEKTEESFKSILSEPSPGIFVFEMLQPRFCEMLLAEVENFEKWVHETKFRIMRPSTMNKYGAVLDDFGLETMLQKLMEDFVRPIATVFFHEVGGSTLDSHHGFVVEYGMDRDVDLGFHVDDSEVTLNVCLGKHFSGGELFFRGVRCERHVNTETQPEEILDYGHVPGHAILHCGRHRHGARATTSGNRMNLLLWCRSSIFRELRKYQKDFSTWCSECQREKRERLRHHAAAIKSELLKREEAG